MPLNMYKKCCLGCPQGGTLYSFPKESKKRLEWFRAIQMDYTIVTRYICFRHFSKRNLVRKRLDKDAVPDINLEPLSEFATLSNDGSYKAGASASIDPLQNIDIENMIKVHNYSKVDISNAARLLSATVVSPEQFSINKVESNVIPNNQKNFDVDNTVKIHNYSQIGTTPKVVARSTKAPMATVEMMLRTEELEDIEYPKLPKLPTKKTPIENPRFGKTFVSKLNVLTSNALTSTISTSNLSKSNVLASNTSTSNLSTSNVSTLNVSTPNVSTSNASTLNASTSNISTLNASTSKTSTLNASTLNTSSSKILTLNVSTSNAPTSNVPKRKKKPKREEVYEALRKIHLSSSTTIMRIQPDEIKENVWQKVENPDKKCKDNSLTQPTCSNVLTCITEGSQTGAEGLQACGFIQRYTKDDKFCLTCFHCSMDFKLSEWEQYIIHYDNTHSLKTNSKICKTKDADNGTKRVLMPQLVNTNEDTDSATEGFDTKEFYCEENEIEDLIVEEKPDCFDLADDSQLLAVPATGPKRVKFITLFSCSDNDQDAAKPNTGIIDFGQTSYTRNLRFLDTLHAHPLLWHPRRHGPAIFDDEAQKFLQKFDTSMETIDFYTSLENARKLQKTYNTLTPIKMEKLAHNLQLQQYIDLVNEIAALSKSYAFTCDVCSYFFLDEDDLQKHKLRRHQIGEIPQDDTELKSKITDHDISGVKIENVSADCSNEILPIEETNLPILDSKKRVTRKRTKTPRSVSSSKTVKRNSRPKSDAVIDFWENDLPRNWKFLEILHAHPLLWHARNFGPAKFDKETEKFLNEFDASMTTNDLCSSLRNARKLHKNFSESSKTRQAQLENKPWLEKYVNLVNEIAVLSKAYAYTCDACTFFFLDENDLYKHKFKRHQIGDISHICSCGLYFADSKSKEAHEATHENEPNLSCEHCALTFFTKRKLQNHLVLNHPEAVPNLQPYECPKCDQKFPQLYMLKWHKLKHEPPKYKCEICGKAYLKAFEFKTHMKGHLNQKDYVCEICGNAFTTKNSLNGHLLKVHKTGKYCCTHCRIYYSTNENLHMHMQKFHPNGTNLDRQRKKHYIITKRYTDRLRAERPKEKKPPEWKCKECGTQFQRFGELNKHRRALGHFFGFRRYKCPHCRLIFNSYQCFIRHLRKVHQIPAKYSDIKNYQQYTGDSDENIEVVNEGIDADGADDDGNLEYVDTYEEVKYAVQNLNYPIDSNVKKNVTAAVVNFENVKYPNTKGNVQNQYLDQYQNDFEIVKEDLDI